MLCGTAGNALNNGSVLVLTCCLKPCANSSHATLTQLVYIHAVLIVHLCRQLSANVYQVVRVNVAAALHTVAAYYGLFLLLSQTQQTAQRMVLFQQPPVDFVHCLVFLCHCLSPLSRKTPVCRCAVPLCTLSEHLHCRANL